MPKDTPASPEGKTCRTCGEVKPADQFDRRSDGGHRNDCKVCRSERVRRRYRETHPLPAVVPLPAGHKLCRKCDQVKPLDAFGRRSGRQSGVVSWCKVCISDVNRQTHSKYYRDNREKKNAASKRHREMNAQHYRERHREYHAKWYQENRERKDRQSAAWRDANRDKAREIEKASRERHPERVRENSRRMKARRRARLRDLPAEPYTRAQLLERDGTACVLGGEELNFEVQHPHPEAITVEHLVPLSWDDSPGDVLTNVSLACARHNIRRQNKPHPAAARKRQELLAAEADLAV